MIFHRTIRVWYVLLRVKEFLVKIRPQKFFEPPKVFKGSILHTGCAFWCWHHYLSPNLPQRITFYWLTPLPLTAFGISALKLMLSSDNLGGKCFRTGAELWQMKRSILGMKFLVAWGMKMYVAECLGGQERCCLTCVHWWLTKASNCYGFGVRKHAKHLHALACASASLHMPAEHT